MLGGVTVDDRRTGTWVTLTQGRPQAMQIRRCRLSIIHGPESGKTADLETRMIRVGAQAGNDLIVSDRRVSGFHFEILLDDRGYRLRDLDSTNGTYVGGHRVRDIYLNPGSVIYIGDHRIRFEPQESSVKVELSEQNQFGGMVGRSVAMRALFAQLGRVAPTDASVLVTGETGTGKELVAEALHEASPRADGPFEVVDCGSLPANLIESELFGHEKGAFTGAHQSHSGVFERASGGTVFLDEIGELPLDLQPKLLGVLERRVVRRVGGTRTFPVDIRVVAATNRDLLKEINHNRFREDLYYRLAVVRVHMPALRDRLEDVPILLDHFLELIPAATDVQLKPGTVENLSHHDYPGNVRELRNLIERAVIMAQMGDEAAIEPVFAAIPAGPSSGPEGAGVENVLQFAVDADTPYKQAKGLLVEEFDKRYLKALLKKFDGNVSKAARAAGLDRMTVHKMLTRRGVVNIRRR